jgi:hypothetical protein
MKFAIGAMSAGDVLDRGLKLLFARLPTFYLIHLIVLLPAFLFDLAEPLLESGPSRGAQVGSAVWRLVSVVLTLFWLKSGRPPPST